MLNINPACSYDPVVFEADWQTCLLAKRPQASGSQSWMIAHPLLRGQQLSSAFPICTAFDIERKGLAKNGIGDFATKQGKFSSRWRLWAGYSEAKYVKALKIEDERRRKLDRSASFKKKLGSVTPTRLFWHPKRFWNILVDTPHAESWYHQPSNSRH